MVKQVLQLKCNCDRLPWGKKGPESLAAALCSKTPGTDFKVEDNEPYAEMWMGTYPKCPALVLDTGEHLGHRILSDPKNMLGNIVHQKFGEDLPFLPKILSIAKATPLQTHPNKVLAADLHRRNPDRFSDPDHRPEMAIALTPAEVFVGWKPLATIIALTKLEPLQQFLPEVRKPDFDDQMLKHVAKAMLDAPPDVIAATGDQLRALPGEVLEQCDCEWIPDMLLRLWEQHGKSDPGALVAVTLMNYMKLSPGESIYIPADAIHAYLSGDIVTCMTRSNNALFCGFCPDSERDLVETFTENLTFAPHEPAEAILKPSRFPRGQNGKTILYKPPVAAFNVLKTDLIAGEKEVIEKILGPSIVFVTNGTGTMRVEEEKYEIGEGSVFFLAASLQTELEAAANENMEVFRAFTE